MITCNLHSYFCVISDIAEEGDDAFAAMRRAKAKSSLKGKGKKFVEVPREDMQYGLEKVQIGMIIYTYDMKKTSLISVQYSSHYFYFED